MLDGLIEEFVGDLADHLAVQLFAEEALEFLGQDVAERQPLHGGQLGPGLTGHLGLLLLAEELFVVAEHAVEGGEINLTAGLDLGIGHLLGGGGEHRDRPLGLFEPLEEMVGQLGRGWCRD